MFVFKCHKCGKEERVSTYKGRLICRECLRILAKEQGIEIEVKDDEKQS